ncbi:MAG: hypothetical protein PHI23_03145 [Candidatus Peribacteraceae bacterium]|nr:hypothetical protein [Candidatus Peribacteraceae bacterium]
MPELSSSSQVLPSRSSLGRLVNQSTILLMVSIGSLILLLALLILFHQNANATKGYMLRTLERERSRLLLEQEVLNMQVAEAQALKNLEEDKIVQAMLPARKPIYTQQDTTVAVMPRQ